MRDDAKTSFLSVSYEVVGKLQRCSYSFRERETVPIHSHYDG